MNGHLITMLPASPPPVAILIDGGKFRIIAASAM
jgi:hypothetical protein